MSGATFEWWLQRRGETALSLDDPTVSITSIEAVEIGEFEISIDAGATDDLGSTSYAERLRITDSDGKRSTFGATFTVKDPNA